MAKKIELKKNPAGGIDLLTERDSGNEVLILTGSQASSMLYWQKMRELAEHAVNIIHDEMLIKKYTGK